VADKTEKVAVIRVKVADKTEKVAVIRAKVADKLASGRYRSKSGR
jgi:hypothetical protein